MRSRLLGAAWRPQAALFDAGIRCTRGGRLRACQRSWFVCMLSHISALVPSAASRRSAIDALTPARPFSSADRACRVTPRRLATSPIDTPSGRYSRRTSPGFVQPNANGFGMGSIVEVSSVGLGEIP